MTAVDRVETARMIAERLQAQHQDELARLLGDPRVARTLWPGQAPPSEAQLLHSLADKLDHWERYGFGLWLLRDRVTGAVVGRGGLQHTRVGGAGEVEAGWAIAPERWGEGLATELAHACVAVGFGTLALGHIIALALPTNVASRRVMEKSGFVYKRDVLYSGLVHVVYRIAAPDDPVVTHRVDPAVTHRGDPKPITPAK